MNCSSQRKNHRKVIWIVAVALLLVVFLPMVLHLHYGWNTLWHQATHHIAVFIWPVIVAGLIIIVLVWTGANLYELRH